MGSTDIRRSSGSKPNNGLADGDGLLFLLSNCPIPTRGIQMPETVLFRMHPTRLAYIRSYLGSMVLVLSWYVLFANVFSLPIQPYRNYTFALLILGVLLAVVTEVRVKTETYTITDYRITERRGILSIRESSVHWDRIADVSLEQSVIERPFGIGTITIESTGGNEAPEITLRYIRRVAETKNTIDQKMLEWKGRSPPQTGT